MQVVKPLAQSKAEALRTANWRRRPIHFWRGQRISTFELTRHLGLDATARRRDAICQLMEDNGVPNTERGHRHAYATLWTERVRARLGEPPRPATVIRWRRKRLAASTSGVTAARRAVAVRCGVGKQVGVAH